MLFSAAAVRAAAAAAGVVCVCVIVCVSVCVSDVKRHGQQRNCVECVRRRRVADAVAYS